MLALFLLLGVSTSLSVTSASIITGGCPLDHPYAFLNGAECCAFPEEDDLPTLELVRNIDCRGGALRLDSTCCKLGQSVACPTVHGCRSTERESCYVDGLLVFSGTPGHYLQERCRQQAAGDKEAWTVKEKLVGDAEWTHVGGCFFKEGGIDECNGWFSSEPDLNPDVSLHDVRQALTTRPKARRCHKSTMRWKKIDGKFKCRTVKELLIEIDVRSK